MASKITDLRSFVVYETFNDSLRLLDDKTRLRFYDLIFQYGLYETFPDDITPLEASFMKQIAFAIDRAKGRRKSQSKNGSTGGAPEGNQNAFKEKKCSACLYYRKCTKSIIADCCEDYTPKPDKNKNKPNQTKSSENNLYVNENDNVNEFKALSLNAPRLSTDVDVRENNEVEVHYGNGFNPIKEEVVEVKVTEEDVDKSVTELEAIFQKHKLELESNLKKKSIDEAANEIWNSYESA